MAHVILITQDVGLRGTLTAHLLNRGHDVVTARCHEEKALRIPWEAAFIDVADGETFGLTLIGRMRVGQPRCRITVIDWILRKKGRDRLVQAIELGADEFLGKPLSRSALRPLLGRLGL